MRTFALLILVTLSASGCSSCSSCSRSDADERASRPSARDDARSRPGEGEGEGEGEDEDEPEDPTKSDQCDAVLRTVNRSDVGKNTRPDKDSVELEQAAAERLAHALGKLELSDPELTALVRAYRKSLNEYVALMRRAALVEPGDVDGMVALIKPAGEIATRSTEITDAFNRYCAGTD